MMRTLFLSLSLVGAMCVLVGATTAPALDERAPEVATMSAVGPTLAADLSVPRKSADLLSFEASFHRVTSGETVRAIRISLKEGEETAFSLPGFPEQTFRFNRTGDAIAIEVETGRSILARLLG